MGKGVKKGYHAKWSYRGRWNETKKKPGVWKFSFRSGKKRKSKSYGSHPRGRTIKWKINGYQDVVKTGKGRYQTHFYGTKRLVRVGYKKPSRR